MTMRIPASMRTRQSLSDLIEGRLSTPAGRSDLWKLATRLIVEEALEGESRDAVGRDYYEHGAEPRPGLPQRRAQRAPEDGGRLCGILGPAGGGPQ